MKSISTLLIVSLFALLACHIASAQEFVPGRIWVRLNEQFSATVKRDSGFVRYPTGSSAVDAAMRKYNVKALKPFFLHDPISIKEPLFYSTGMYRDYVFVPDPKVTDAQTTQRIVDELKRLPDFEQTDMMPIRHPEWTPNDWNIGGRDMWGLDSMHCPQAWDITTGGEQILAVTIDTGVDYEHEDLVDNIKINHAEDLNHNNRLDLPDFSSLDPRNWTFGDMNGIDDDGNGIIDDVIGYDFVTTSGPPPNGLVDGEDYAFVDPTPFGHHMHGTHTVGTLAAVTNNGRGVPSASFNIKTLALRAAYAYYDANRELQASFEGENYGPAIQYAVNRGAKILSLSFGGYTYFPPDQSVINFATGRGRLVFGSAGNDSVSTLHYPSCYNGVYAVAAINSNYVISPFSNFGNWIWFSGPGNEIWSTTNAPSTYESWPGTSMATPNVAAAAAFIWRQNTSLSRQSVIDYLAKGATRLDSYNPNFQNRLGYGMPNIQFSLRLMQKSLILTDPSSEEYDASWWIGTRDSITYRTMESDPNRRIVIQMKSYITAPMWRELYRGAYVTLPEGKIYVNVDGQPDEFNQVRIFFENDSTTCDSSKVFRTQKKINILRPYYNEKLVIGTPYELQFETHPDINRVNIDVSRTYPVSWTRILSNVNTSGTDPVNYCSWTVTAPASESVMFRISTASGTYAVDTNSYYNRIVYPIYLHYPIGGERFRINDTVCIRWATEILNDPVNVLYNNNYPGGSWTTLASNISDTSWIWHPTGPITSNARIKIVRVSNNSYVDQSDTNFTVARERQLIYPLGGNKFWYYSENGFMVTFKYNASWTSGTNIQINRNYPSGNWETLATNVPMVYDPIQTVTWWSTATPPLTHHARIRILNAVDPTVGDTSDTDFTIAPAYLVTRPNGGEVFLQNRNDTIRWTPIISGLTSKIQLNRNYPTGEWETLDSSVVQGYSPYFHWIPTLPASTHCRIRVVNFSGAYGDTSDADFQVGGIAHLAVTPSDTLDFGVGVLGQQISRDAIIRNTGTGPLSVIVALQNDPEFSWTALNTSIPVGGSSTRTVQWTVSTGGNISQMPIYGLNPDTTYNLWLKGDEVFRMPISENFNVGLPPRRWGILSANTVTFVREMQSLNPVVALHHTNNSNNDVDFLTMPRIDFTTDTVAYLSFDYSYFSAGILFDSLFVDVSINNGATYPYTIYANGGTGMLNRQQEGSPYLQYRILHSPRCILWSKRC